MLPFVVFDYQRCTI